MSPQYREIFIQYTTGEITWEEFLTKEAEIIGSL